MNVFVSFDGDTIGQMVGRARLNDDVEGVRRINQSIEHGNAIWRSWCEKHGGSVVEIGGDEGVVEISADYLDELPDIRRQYSEAVGASVSVGVGTKISESSKALLAAKLRGKDRIEFYTEEVDEMIEQAQAKPGSEAEKIVEEYLTPLGKASEGFAGPTAPTQQTVDKPVPMQGEHSEAQDVIDTAAAGPKPAEQTHAATDFENEFHDAARSQEQEDTEKHAQATKNIADVKQKVLAALQMLKQQAPIMEQVKQSAPQAYQAMMGLAQAVIGLSREIQAAAPIAKSESLDKAVPNYRVTAKKHPKRADDQDMYRYVQEMHTGSGADFNKVPMDTNFRLTDVPVAKLPANRPSTLPRVEQYAKLKTPFPPIVIGRNGSIPDGHHRIAAARLRGDQTIRAYVPEEELHNYAMTAIKKSEFSEGAYPEQTDDIEILDYFMRIHMGSRADFKKVPYDTEYQLVELPVDELATGVSGKNARAQKYSRLDTPFPPIIMKSEEEAPIDGNHRVAAAKLRGDKTIRAYVPVEELAKSARRNPQDMMVDSVRGALTDDLRKPQYRGSANCMAGHCYVASEALYHLLGGKEAGWTPMHVSHEGGPHWYLKNRHSGKILDATSDQFQTPVPYHLGKGKGFLTALPSKRAGKVISQVLTRKRELDGGEPMQKMAISDIPLGKRTVGSEYDYTHVLPEEHKKSGYSIRVRSVPGNRVRAHLYYKGMNAGYIAAEKNGQSLFVDNSFIDPLHRGKGLGVPLYESLYAHAKHKLNAPYVTGGAHSTSANRVHQALATKHGLDYKPRHTNPNITGDEPFDGKHVGYGYALKGELKADKDYEVDSDGDLEKSGLPMPGASAHHHLVLPTGTVKGNKVKVTHSDGKQGWVQVGAGQIRSQDPSGHPVSSRNPGGK